MTKAVNLMAGCTKYMVVLECMPTAVEATKSTLEKAGLTCSRLYGLIPLEKEVRVEMQV